MDYVPDLKTIPTEYHDLQVVFSKEQALCLPPHRRYDLLTGGLLPTSQLYNISGPEGKTMDDDIKDSLAACIIHASTSQVGTVFFFVSKKR